MRLAYLDTSAALKLIVEEAESEALTRYLTSQPDLVLVASWLLYTELHCAAARRPETLRTELVREALDQVEFVDVTRKDYFDAATFAPLRSNDALHLAVALRLEVGEMITYDHELIDTARRFGLGSALPEPELPTSN